MKLLFIDETSDSGNNNYLGVCAALIDATKYAEIKKEFLCALHEFGWDLGIEFKGSWLFSSSQGCKTVLINQRVELTKRIMSINSAASNSRIKFVYVYTSIGSTKLDYLRLVGGAIEKALDTATTTRNGKNLLSICCDKRSDVLAENIEEIIEPILEKKKYVLIEGVNLMKSNTQTVGIVYADIVGYLKSRIDNIKVDSSLFENLDAEAAKKNTQLQKYLTSTEIIDSIKNMKVYSEDYQMLPRYSMMVKQNGVLESIRPLPYAGNFSEKLKDISSKG